MMIVKNAAGVTIFGATSGKTLKRPLRREKVLSGLFPYGKPRLFVMKFACPGLAPVLKKLRIFS